MKFIKGIRADVKDVVDCAETLDVASPTKGLQTRKFKQVLFGCVPVKVSTAEDTSADARLQSAVCPCKFSQYLPGPCTLAGYGRLCIRESQLGMGG